MNEKLEIAKLATQLTVAILGNSTDVRDISRKAHVAGDKETPAALLTFDVAYKHLQEVLTK